MSMQFKDIERAAALYHVITLLTLVRKIRCIYFLSIWDKWHFAALVFKGWRVLYGEREKWMFEVHYILLELLHLFLSFSPGK